MFTLIVKKYILCVMEYGTKNEPISIESEKKRKKTKLFNCLNRPNKLNWLAIVDTAVDVSATNTSSGKRFQLLFSAIVDYVYSVYLVEVYRITYSIRKPARIDRQQTLQGNYCQRMFSSPSFPFSPQFIYEK